MPTFLRLLVALVATLLIPALLWLVVFHLDGLRDVGLVLSLIAGVLLLDALLFWIALGSRLRGMDRLGVAFVLPLLIIMLSWSLMRDSVQELIEQNRAAAAAAAPAIVGNDRDAHGCIGSAGYAWCARDNACVRPWELAAARGLEAGEAAFRAYCDTAPPAPGSRRLPAWIPPSVPRSSSAHAWRWASPRWAR